MRRSATWKRRGFELKNAWTNRTFFFCCDIRQRVLFRALLTGATAGTTYNKQAAFGKRPRLLALSGPCNEHHRGHYRQHSLVILQLPPARLRSPKTKCSYLGFRAMNMHRRLVPCGALHARCARAPRANSVLSPP